MATTLLSRPTVERADRRATHAPAGLLSAPVAPDATIPDSTRRPDRTQDARPGAGGRATRPVRPRAARRPVARCRVREGLAPRPLAERARPAAGALRLTRRGRLVLLTLFVVVLSGAFALGRVGADGATTVAPPARVGQLTVQPGDTLWSVARTLAPGQDPRPVVEQLRRLNRLSDDQSLQSGQQLLLPQRQ